MATVTGWAMGGVSNTAKVSVHLYIQQYKNGSWVNYDDWLVSENGASCFVSKTLSVPKGYKYRAKASCYAYAGSSCEHVTKYSGEVSA